MPFYSLGTAGSCGWMGMFPWTFFSKKNLGVRPPHSRPMVRPRVFAVDAIPGRVEFCRWEGVSLTSASWGPLENDRNFQLRKPPFQTGLGLQKNTKNIDSSQK